MTSAASSAFFEEAMLGDLVALLAWPDGR